MGNDRSDAVDSDNRDHRLGAAGEERVLGARRDGDAFEEWERSDEKIVAAGLTATGGFGLAGYLVAPDIYSDGILDTNEE